MGGFGIAAGLGLAVAQVKSYLAGNPAIRLALNDELVIGRQDGAARGAWGSGGSLDMVQLDDCNFHESVSLDRFEAERTLQLVPPDGEFALMQYRCAHLYTRGENAQPLPIPCTSTCTCTCT